MEAAGSTRMLVSYCNITWCYNPEDVNLRVTVIMKRWRMILMAEISNGKT
jgi:hypothetical protein